METPHPNNLDDGLLTTLWPNKVKCKMDIPKWRDALAAAGLLPQFDDVLDGLANGFHQGIPDHGVGVLQWFTPPNHLSATLARPKIEKTIKDKLMRGQMFGPFTAEEVARRFKFFQSSPLGTVVNGDGLVRPINNLSFPRKLGSIPSVNSFVDKDDFTTTWDNFQIVASFFQARTTPCLLALFNWEKAYRQIPTHPSQWPYLMTADFDGCLLLDTRISFGGVTGCGTFGRPANAWKLIMLHKFQLTKIFRWVDDNLFIKEVNDDTEMLNIVKRSTKLGVMTNEEKYTPFKTEQKFIGFIWNGTDQTVRLPPAKLEQRKAQVKTFLVEGIKFSFDNVEVMVGRLNHIAYLFPQMKCNLCGLYLWLKSWVNKKAKKPVPRNVTEDLQRWMHVLEAYEPTRLIPEQTPTDIGWIGDASTSYGLGVIVAGWWAWLPMKDSWRLYTDHKREIMLLEMAAIRVGLLMLLKLGIQPGRTYLATTETAIKKRHSRNVDVNDKWRKIQDLLLLHQINICSRRVSLEENRAN
jgi:hypothetical protein